MHEPLQDLLTNFAIIAIIFSVWTIGEQWFCTWSIARRNLAFGVLCGLGAMALIRVPFRLESGVAIDLRATLIAISGLFGGPLSAVVTAAMSLVIRALAGGTGMWIGFFGISVAAGIGIAGNRLLQGRIPGVRQVMLFALATGAGSGLNFFWAPYERWSELFPQVALPLMSLVLTSTLLSALVLAQGRSREEAINQNRMFRSIIDALPDCLNAKDRDGRFIAANPTTARFLGIPVWQDIIGRTGEDYFPPAVAERFSKSEQAVMRTGRPVTLEQEIPSASNESRWLSTLKAPLYDANGAMVGTISHSRDITAQKSMEIAFEESQRRLYDALTHMADALVMFDREKRLVFSNDQYLKLFPLTADLRVPGVHIRDIVRTSVERGEELARENETADMAADRVTATFGASGQRHINLADGRWLEARTRPTRNGACLIVFSDITRIKQAEKQLEEIANTDSLTGLANRRAFDRELAREAARASRSGTPLSLLLIDLDHFKAFNDNYGHPQGDSCLREVAQCISQSLRRATDIGARYGGEEFAIILPGTGMAGAMKVAADVRSRLDSLAIAHVASPSGVVTMSIGITSGNAPSGPAAMLSEADEALYRAKAGGRNLTQTSDNDTRPVPPIQPFLEMAGRKELVADTE